MKELSDTKIKLLRGGIMLVIFLFIALFNVEQRDAVRNKTGCTETETEPESTEKKLP